MVHCRFGWTIDSGDREDERRMKENKVKSWKIKCCRERKKRKRVKEFENDEKKKKRKRKSCRNFKSVQKMRNKIIFLKRAVKLVDKNH